MQFIAPTADQILAIKANAGMAEIAAYDRFAAASADLVEAIVEGIGAFAAGEWAPLNRIGDVEGARNRHGPGRVLEGHGRGQCTKRQAHHAADRRSR